MFDYYQTFRDEFDKGVTDVDVIVKSMSESIIKRDRGFPADRSGIVWRAWVGISEIMARGLLV